MHDFLLFVDMLILLVPCGLDLPYDEKDKAHYHQDPEDEHKDDTEPSHPPSPHHAKIHAQADIITWLLSKDVTRNRYGKRGG